MISILNGKNKSLLFIGLLPLLGAAVISFVVSHLSVDISNKNSPFGQTLSVNWDHFESTENDWQKSESKRLNTIYFGFLSCPDVCPLALRNMQSALNELEESDRKKINFLFVSLDPERDSLEKLRAALGSIHKDIIGLRPRQDQITSLASHFMFHTERTALTESAIRYIVSHPNRFYYVDHENRLLEATSEVSGSDLAKRVRGILRSIQ